jgi:hypothetical protein
MVVVAFLLERDWLLARQAGGPDRTFFAEVLAFIDPQ